jgi:serine/threonine-protein kinase
MLTRGTRVGRYEIVDRLGSGGMGEVYRAIDTHLGRHVALKILSPEVANDEKRLKRFEIEAQAIAELSHPNILAIFDVGREQDMVYAALELVEGATLTTVLAEGPLSSRRTTDYARQLAAALAAAHAHGVWHGDTGGPRHAA